MIVASLVIFANNVHCQNLLNSSSRGQVIYFIFLTLNKLTTYMEGHKVT